MWTNNKWIKTKTDDESTETSIMYTKQDKIKLWCKPIVEELKNTEGKKLPVRKWKLGDEHTLKQQKKKSGISPVITSKRNWL